MPNTKYRAEDVQSVEELRNQIVYKINNDHSGKIRFYYDWLEDRKTARFILYDTPKALASFIFDSLDQLNTLAEDTQPSA